MRELGELLKQTRESKNITLEEVSVATKISIKVLQALEEGDVDRLPPRPFVRGFVQAYARYLSLDVKEVLNLYQNAMGANQPAQLPAVEKKVLDKNLPGGGRNIITVILIILLIIAIVIVQRINSKREAEMRGGEVQAINGNSEPLNIKGSPSAGPGISPSPETAGAVATTSPTPGASLTPAPSPSPTATPTPAPTETPKPTPTATPEKKKKETPAPEATPAPEGGANPEEGTEPAEATPQEVIVEALDKVTVKVSIDGGPEKEIAMTPDQIQTFKAKSKLKLYTPDGGAISVINNGFDLGVPGNLGQPKTLVFPK